MQPIELSQFQSLSAAILSDVLDSLGLMGQAMRPFMRPLDEGSVLIGRARTGLYMPVECAGVRVVSGDIVFGDADGVVVIPQDRAAEVLERARKKVTGENNTRAELEQGSLLGEVYRKYGVL